MLEIPLAVARVDRLDAPIERREAVAARVAELPASPERIALLTCHRVELYLAGPPEDAETVLARSGLAPAELIVERGRDALAHLFRVAAGLDSAVLGERQILGQLRAAYDRARARGVAPALAAAFERALHVGRELRRATPLGRERGSLGSLAVRAALAGLDDPAGATVVVVGAGEMGTLATRALARRVRRVVVVNRDGARARELARRYGADDVGIERLADVLRRADAVISAADTRGTLLTRTALEPAAARGATVVDVAVPRSVAPDARDMLGTRYRTVDDLVANAHSGDEALRGSIAERCEAEADRFAADLASRRAAATIARLHEHGDELRRRHLERALSRLGHLPERDRRVVSSLASALTHALLHEPTRALRGSPERQDDARALFGL